MNFAAGQLDVWWPASRAVPSRPSKRFLAWSGGAADHPPRAGSAGAGDGFGTVCRHAPRTSNCAPPVAAKRSCPTGKAGSARAVGPRLRQCSRGRPRACSLAVRARPARRRGAWRNGRDPRFRAHVHRHGAGALPGRGGSFSRSSSFRLRYRPVASRRYCSRSPARGGRWPSRLPRWQLAYRRSAASPPRAVRESQIWWSRRPARRPVAGAATIAGEPRRRGRCELAGAPDRRRPPAHGAATAVAELAGWMWCLRSTVPPRGHGPRAARSWALGTPGGRSIRPSSRDSAARARRTTGRPSAV